VTSTPPTHEQLTYEDLLQIVELIKSSEQFSEFRLKIGEVEIELKRRTGGGAIRPPAVEPQHDSRSTQTSADPAHAGASSAPPRGAANAVAPEVPDDACTDANTRIFAPPAAPTWPAGSAIVRAPMVGTFYRSPEPGAPPFVSIGQPVDASTTVCIIEVMKLMNSIAAGTSGIVTHILVDDAQAVAAGAPLIVVDPRGAAG
jgi:acetyl-CoA carboxylase biotin carboxyl carrier protein